MDVSRPYFGSIDYYEDTDHDIPSDPAPSTIDYYEDTEHDVPSDPAPGTSDKDEDTDYYDESVEENAELTESQGLIIAEAKAAFERRPRLPWFILDLVKGEKTAAWRRAIAPKLMALVGPMDDDCRAAFYQMLEKDEHGYHWTHIIGAFYDQYPQAMTHHEDPNHHLGPNGPLPEREVARLQREHFGSWNWGAAVAKTPDLTLDEIGPMGEVEPCYNVKCRCDDCKIARCKLGRLAKRALRFRDAIRVNLSRECLWRKVRGKMPRVMRSHVEYRFV
jgi:hypothetical protein